MVFRSIEERDGMVERLKILHRFAVGSTLVVKHDNQFVDQLAQIAEAREKERLAIEAKNNASNPSPTASSSSGSPKIAPVAAPTETKEDYLVPEQNEPHVVDLHRRIEKVFVHTMCSLSYRSIG